MRHLGLRGAPIIRRRFRSTSTPNLKYMSATLWIMFYIYEFLCWIERLMRIMPACFAPWNIIPFIQYVKSHVLKSYVCARCVSLLSSPGKASVHPTRPTHHSQDMQGLRYICRMANTMSQTERDIDIAYAASLDDFLESEGDSSSQARQVRFDSDSYRIGIDTHATASISSDRNHFIDLKSVPRQTCQGFSDEEGTGAAIEGMGTLVFRIEDDTGAVHTIKLPNSLYIPTATSGTLISPQQWAQVDKAKNGAAYDGTGFQGLADDMILFWGNRRYRKTMAYDPSTNTPYFQTAPGSINYRSYNAVYASSDAFHSPPEQVAHLPPDIKRLKGEETDYIGDELLLTTEPDDLDQKMPANGSPNESDWDVIEAKGILEQMQDNSIKRDDYDQADGGPTFEPTATPSKPNQADPNGPCPVHPNSNHIWRDCSEYRRRSLVREGALTFDPTATPQDLVLDEPEAADPKAELMRWHVRLGHAPFPRILALAKNGDLPKKLADVAPPICAGCMFGAMTRRRWREKPTNEQRQQPSRVFLAQNVGDCVSVDQMISTQVGFIGQTKGRLTTQRYRAVTIFVDHLSRCKYVYLMTSLTSEETIKAKQKFELFAIHRGVHIKSYNADNGRFADNAFIADCQAKQQGLTFCGVNAHWQNGIAESAIRYLSEQARKQLLHAKARWPEAIDLALWPYAIRQSAYIQNHLPPAEGGRSPMAIFCNTNVEVRLREMHTLFCPVYTLQSELAAGNTLPRWSPRCRIGINLGRAPDHARSVQHVLHLSTGLVSSQYHIQFDDSFQTTIHGREDMNAMGPASNWKVLAGLINVDGDATLARLGSVGEEPSTLPITHPLSDIDDRPGRLNPVSRALEEAFDTEATLDEMATKVFHEALKLGADDEPTELEMDTARKMTTAWLERDQTEPDAAVPHRVDEVYEEEGETMSSHFPSSSFSTPSGSSAESPVVIPHSHETSQTATSLRGSRVRRPTAKLSESSNMRHFHGKRGYYTANSAQSVQSDPLELEQSHDAHLELQERMRHPIAFHAEMQGDTMYYHQAMRQADSKEFVKAIVKEVNGHVDSDNWELVKRSQVPSEQQVIPSVWAMKRKRNLTTNEITKYKARLNIHGGKQTYGVNYFDTYAPVITWFAIRILIIMALMYGWSLKQVDFVMAYPQAPVENDLYMELPHGIATKHGNSKEHVLKITSNLYGQKQAGRVWNQYLVSKLQSIGFQQSLVDECIFYRGTTIFAVYVDDGIVLDLESKNLDTFVQELKDAKLDVEDQGDPADYIGVNISKDVKTGTYNFNQKTLIDSVVEDCGLTRSRKVKQVPGKCVPLLPCLNSPKFDSNMFDYRSAIGKLNYIAQTTRPDIMAATHMAAKYAQDPRKEHGDAVLHIVMYLKATRHIGLRFKPDPTRGFEDYVDADFSGLWSPTTAASDPSTSKSRSGWIVFYAGCPIIWASKLQGMVALSTTEAEYIALSQSLRDVLPIMDLMTEFEQRGFKVMCTEPYVYCKAFEDNSGALELARLPKLRPRSKHININYHHFREHVRKGLVKIFPIGTDHQVADILTKNVPQNVFVRHRVKMCGQ